MNRSISDLEDQLAGPETHAPLGGPDLDRIHRLGTRQRRIRRVVGLTVGVLSITAVAAVGVAVSDLGPAPQDRGPVAVMPAEPHRLSTLARRVLREVPGAAQVSDWQVTIPGPGKAPRHDEPLGDLQLVGAPVSLGGHAYTGVTAYPRGQFPDWLYDEVQRIEQEELGDANGYPVGSTDMGILVDRGQASLACVAWSGGESHEGSSCAPAFVARLDDKWYLQWSMGTDDFLMPGEPMEVFLSKDYSTGEPSTIAIAGLDGTDVASADFVNTHGTVVAGKVESGTLSPGDTLLHANVPGELARVIAYDGSGEVIEDHELKPCDSPVDCEVR